VSEPKKSNSVESEIINHKQVSLQTPKTTETKGNNIIDKG